jgi:hypothetical protein
MKFLMRGVAERCTETTDVAPTVAIPQSRERAEDWSRSPRGCSLRPHAAVGASIRSGSERVSVLVMVVISHKQAGLRLPRCQGHTRLRQRGSRAL